MKKSGASEERAGQKRGFFPSIGRFFTRVWKGLYKSAGEDLNNPDVFRRMGAAAIWMFIFFAVAWVISYFFLKSDYLTKTWLVDKFFGIKAPDQWAYWYKVLFIAGKILLHYLVVMVVFILLLAHFRVGRINLSYVFLYAYTALMGGVVGTNSFAYYARTKLAALITFVRFSLWQILAFMLATVAVTGLAYLATPGWLDGSWKRIRPFTKPVFKGEDFEVLLYAVLILIASCIAEARLIVFYKLYM